jgi:ceramide glucosyltransferase
VWAVFGGVTVVWRGKKFWVGMDMKVHAVEEQGAKTMSANGNGSVLHDRSKTRRD